MTFTQLCKQIDLAFEQSKNPLVMIEMVFLNKNYFVAQGTCKQSLSSNMINFKVKHGLKGDLFLTVIK